MVSDIKAPVLHKRFRGLFAYTERMATPTRISMSGDALILHYDDGSQKRATPTTAGQWLLSKGAGTPVTPPGGGGGGGSSDGSWQWPFQYTRWVIQTGVYAQLAQFQRNRLDPFTGRRSDHTGLDFGAGGINGQPIPSAHAGVVEISASPGAPYFGYGAAILIRHPDGTACLYAHRQQKELNVGDQVKRGQIIGHVGATGWATGPHLHWETWEKGDVKVNPRTFMKDRGVAET